ncbi:DNA topoisomerase (ATP-hydrolyzing) subunit A [Bacillus smithii]|uniref:DNA topoisomerase (ATP-hydrolyzing) subunit A n=1 Tax=Bacillus smithii TaxID=1479 RepID=UPI002E21C71E|nr:DNA topoisomerase (ATP-hydrolyzing) subunit A [Bacillus smithii]MED4928859.1 DNA topoisomerase (ATP-hydrolyzing) subunit A [Bacillus smithii]
MTNEVINQLITDTLEEHYMPYSAHVILHRALPEIDGLKPSQRRVLYTMFKMGLLKGQRKKSQGVVGQTLFLHPHGDASVYQTLVRMTKDNESMLYPFIDSKGNFGKVYSRDMKEASARYTEVRLMPIAQELFKDINKDAVDMVDNYDGTIKEPRLLPVTFPNILVNPSQGTAVGMASNIPSFNINEIIDFTIEYIKNRNIKVLDYIKAPDFPTGGTIIYNENNFNKIYNTGKGSFKIRAKYHIKENSIIIDEIPYTTTFEAIIEKITDLIKEGKIKDIVDINDIYGINTKGIEIVVKNNTNKELLMEKLYRMTPLEDTFSCNFNIIVEGEPKTLGIKGIIHEWIKFRVNSIKRVIQYDVNKKSNRRHLLKGLEKILLNIDEAIKIIRNSKADDEVINNLMSKFDIDKAQAEFIAEIKLRNLNRDYIVKSTNEIEKLEAEIKELTDTYNDKIRLAQIIISELEKIKDKYGQERKTDILNEGNLLSIDDKELEIENYNTRIILTEEGYLKKIPLTSLRGNSTQKLKDNDQIKCEFDSNNKADILIFTDKRNCYKIKSYELPDHKPSVLGEYLPSHLQLDEDEKIVYVTATEDYKGYLIIGFDNGKVAKIDMRAYQTKTNRSLLKNAFTSDQTPVYWNTITKDTDLVAISSINKVILFNTSIINAKTSRTTIGVQIMKSKDDSKMLKVLSVNDCEFEDVEYYRIHNAGVGKYLRKNDLIK